MRTNDQTPTTRPATTVEMRGRESASSKTADRNNEITAMRALIVLPVSSDMWVDVYVTAILRRWLDQARLDLPRSHRRNRRLVGVDDVEARRTPRDARPRRQDSRSARTLSGRSQDRS